QVEPRAGGAHGSAAQGRRRRQRQESAGRQFRVGEKTPAPRRSLSGAGGADPQFDRGRGTAYPRTAAQADEPGPRADRSEGLVIALLGLALLLQQAPAPPVATAEVDRSEVLAGEIVILTVRIEARGSEPVEIGEPALTNL